jgi:hypothetical protein
MKVITTITTAAALIGGMAVVPASTAQAATPALHAATTNPSLASAQDDPCLPCIVIEVGIWIWEHKDALGLAWAQLTHGVTNVKRWRNETGQELEVWKLDGSYTWADHYRIAPGQTVDADMWIPWADNADQYAKKHAVIMVGGKPLAYIWQSGTQIRFNTSDEFVPEGQSAAGESTAGGNRTILVTRDPQSRLGFAIGGY